VNAGLLRFILLAAAGTGLAPWVRLAAPLPVLLNGVPHIGTALARRKRTRAR